MIRYVKGDLLDMADRGEFDVIVHGCNCFNNMGAGIAYAIARRYPAAREADAVTVRGDKSKLGTFTWAKQLTKTNPVRVFKVINAYTQYGCNASKAVDLFEYDHFELILTQLVVNNSAHTRFGFPLIGCGLAGGNRERIMKQIEDIVPNATIVEWDK